MVSSSKRLRTTAIQRRIAASLFAWSLATTLCHTSGRGANLLYILSGTGDITIDGSTSPIRSGTVCQARAGEKHSLRNLGDDNLLILAIYDPRAKEGLRL